ncbi:MAG: hypothetical protein AB1546_03920 [bacterium]
MRRSAFLEHCAEHGAGSFYAAVAAAMLKRSVPNPDRELNKSLAQINARTDCADFPFNRLLRAVYKHDALGNIFTSEQFDAARKAILNFKYWIDEPGADSMITWTENHQILFHTAEYLAGQRFPDEIFANNGKTGRWHMGHARPLILQWIDRRARWGFSEWDSNVYYEEDLAALLNLAEFAEDPEISTRAAMMIDLMLFDIAVDQFHGVYGATHGRSYASSIIDGHNDSVASVAKLLWGTGSSNYDCSFGAGALATGGRYKPPDVIISIGQDMPEEMLSRERHGISIEDAPNYGLRYDNPDDFIVLWGMGYYTHPEVIVNTMRMADERDLWDQPFFEDAASFRPLIKTVNLRHIASTLFEPNRTFLGEVNKVTYRTPDYMLSSAQDYRPGGLGNQHHIWQATLGADAVVFVNNPGSMDDGSRTPTFWGGSNRLPRVAQYKNALICLFNIENKKALGERDLFLFTHAYFPRHAFDRVDTDGHWVFAQKGDGYIALYSDKAIRWTEDGRESGREIIADGGQNVWICVLGRRGTDGEFENFKDRILAAPLVIEDMKVDFTIPALGNLKFGWTDPFIVVGQEIPLSGFKRFDNVYSRSEFNSNRFVIEHADHSLTLDFDTAMRVEK